MTGMLIDTATGDLMVADGALVLGDNTGQVAEAILRACRGEFKEHPLLGAEAVKLQGANSDTMWPAKTRDMLHAAGVMVKQVRIENNEIILE